MARANFCILQALAHRTAKVFLINMRIILAFGDCRSLRCCMRIGNERSPVQRSWYYPFQRFAARNCGCGSPSERQAGWARLKLHISPASLWPAGDHEMAAPTASANIGNQNARVTFAPRNMRSTRKRLGNLPGMRRWTLRQPQRLTLNPDGDQTD